MFLSLTCTAQDATDLGFLLLKNPANLFTKDLAFGRAYVFYPEAGAERCTAALWVDVDPVGLVRRQGSSGGGGGRAAGLEQYVNDRPYVASSFLAVALADVYSTALSGRSKERPERATELLPLEACCPAVHCAGGPRLAAGLFEPLGYQVVAEPCPADDPAARRVWSLRLSARTTVRDLLTHLYVLLPVLDDAKHYWVGADEVEKLLRRGEGWLPTHPLRELIVRRYLRYRGGLARAALERLGGPDEETDDEESTYAPAELTLYQQRVAAVAAALRGDGLMPARVLDLGCGEGRLLEALAHETGMRELVGYDVGARSLERAAARLHLDRRPPAQRPAIKLLQGSLVYRDERIKGFDAAALVEVIEHVDPDRLPALERAVFECAAPRRLVVTTPNVEYNVRMTGLAPGKRRHGDHRFEWSRVEFRTWCARLGAAHGYSVAFRPVGPDDPEVGPPTQLAVFERAAHA
ncbi:MAG: 3' terminal RNA ribose 2'-O-methyltransferase Hen1 [Planctomycetes bacterium]|nr:3' terminal RNA ribose 2'-O-methyltransferase Hen1 [Planctomycetota bacterium]